MAAARCLTDLPDDLLRHVLSVTPAKEAASTPVLSRRRRTSGRQHRLALVQSQRESASSAGSRRRVLAFVTAFSVGLGPLAPAYGVEILPLRLRVQGTSLGIAANRLTCGILSMTFISLANTISMAGCFFLYASTAVAACVFVYVRLPETKGRTLEGMDVLFAK